MKSLLALATLCVAFLIAMPAVASAAWTAQQIGTADSCPDSLGCGAVATDADGNSYAAWADEDVDNNKVLLGSYRPAGGSWGGAETIATSPTVLNGHSIDLDFDGGGRVFVVWQGYANQVHARTRSATGTWGNTMVFASSGPSTTYPYSDDFPEIAVNSSGEAVAAWTALDIPYVASANALGTWTVKYSLAYNPSRSVGVGIDDSGEITAAWSWYEAGPKKQHVMRTSFQAGAAPPSSGTDLRTPAVTVSDRRIGSVQVDVAPSGATVASWSMPNTADSSNVEAVYRNAAGSWDSAPTLVNAGGASRAGIDDYGNAVVVWPVSTAVRGYTAARHTALGSWSTPEPVGSTLHQIGYDFDVAADGSALLGVTEYGGADGLAGISTVLMAADGSWGAATAPVGNVDNSRPARVSLGGGQAAAFWQLGDQYVTGHHAYVAAGDYTVTNPPGDPGPGDGGGGGGGDTGGGGNAPLPSSDPPPANPGPQLQLTDTTVSGRMPDVRGLRLDKAKDAIERARVLFSDIDISWSKTAPRNTQRGDVVSQSPKAGTTMVNGIGTAPKIRLSLYQGPKGAAGKKCAISTLSRDLKGADFTLVEDLLAKTKCKTDWNVRLGSRDEADVSKLSGRGSRVTATVTCPKNTEDHDLFAFVREYPSGLSFGAGDWALTVSGSQRNNVRLTVVQRGGYVEGGVVKGQLIKNARLLIDTSDVGGTDSRAAATDADGTTIFTLMALKPGKVDICIIGEASDGNVVYGATQLTVIRRSGDFDTVGGRHMKKGAGASWKDAAVNDGPILIKESVNARASVDLFGPIVSAIQTLISGFSGKVSQTINASGGPQTKVKTVQKDYQFGIGQFGFGNPIGALQRLVSVVPVPLIGQAGSNAIAAGGGNAIAAGGGNAIAAGGGNLIGQAGSNAIAAGGGNAIAAGGGNILFGSTDLRTSRAIAAGGGNIIGQAGSNAIAAGGGNLIGPAGSNAIAVGGGNLIGQAGSNAIAAGGGN